MSPQQANAIIQGRQEMKRREVLRQQLLMRSYLEQQARARPIHLDSQSSPRAELLTDWDKMSASVQDYLDRLHRRNSILSQKKYSFSPVQGPLVIGQLPMRYLR